MTEKKPDHNKYDNIYEIRKSRDYGRLELNEMLRRIKGRFRGSDYTDMKVKTSVYNHHSPESFILGVEQELHNYGLKVPAWKIMAAHVDNPNVGAIYYIIQGNGHTHAFRGTYGYWGTGPHQSAVIETYIEERLQLSLELRDGDYLLIMLGLT